jgi:hypothetical protein
MHTAGAIIRRLCVLLLLLAGFGCSSPPQATDNVAVDPAADADILEMNPDGSVRSARINPASIKGGSEPAALRRGLPSRRYASEPAEDAARQALRRLEDHNVRVPRAGDGEVLTVATTLDVTDDNGSRINACAEQELETQNRSAPRA